MGTHQPSSMPPQGFPSLQALATTARRLSSDPHPAHALWILVERLRNDLGLDRAGVFALNHSTNTLELIAGVDADGKPQFSGRSFPVDGENHPIKLVARRELPCFYSEDVHREYPDCEWAPGVHAHGIVPILAGDVLVGALAVDNGLTGRGISRNVLEPLFLYAGLAALPLFALYHRREQERVEAIRRNIHREVLFSVTGGKIRLCEQDEIDREWPQPNEKIPIEHEAQVRTVREAARRTAVDAGMADDRAADFGLCASEAATNALLHGRGGAAFVDVRDDRVRLRISDSGSGINPDDLPKATLQKGWSSRASLGLGFTVINETADKVFLHTGPGGTTIIIEMTLAPSNDLPFQLSPLLWDDDLVAQNFAA